MTLFVALGALLVTIALSWLMPSLLRRRVSDNSIATTTSNLDILRDELAALERDVSAGTLSQQQYQQARQDIERRVLEEGRESGTPPSSASPGNGWRTAMVLAVSIPLCTVLLYLQLGSPAAVNVSARASGHQPSAKEIEAMVAGLATRLEQQPEDANGWVLLGRSYAVMKRYAESARAYARAAELVKDDADLLADYADILAMSDGGRIEGKPLQLIEQALKIDSTHWKALAMAGTAAFARKDYKMAIGYWEKIASRTDLSPELTNTVAGNIEEARKLAGIKTPAVAKAAPGTSVAPAGSVRGSVTLAAAIAAKAAPTDTVFIFARAAEGPRMPLAILRRQVSDLPYKFILDDSMAMAPEMKLSKFPEVIVGARVSKSGNAVAQSGDLQGLSQKLKVGGPDVNIVIDQIVP